MRNARLLWLIAPAIFAQAAAETELPPATGLKPLLKMAWSAGEARVRLVGGRLPELFRQFHSAHGALIARATVAERLAEPGCARYLVEFSQQGALADGGTRKDTESLRISLSHCLDGSAPSSAINIDLLGELLQRRRK